MKPDLESHEILSKEDALIIHYDDSTIVTNIIHLDNEKELISFFDLKPTDKNSKPKLVSVPIASAVTAYARMHMSYFKMMCLEKGIILYYSDTDSIDISAYLPDHLVSKELGQMKLEQVWKEVVFIAPKVYGGIIENNKEYVKVKGLKIQYLLNN